jgi:hypothetical protein
MSDCEPYLGHDDRYALSSDASIGTGRPGLGANVDTTLVLGVSSTVGQIKSGHCRFQNRPLAVKTGQPGGTGLLSHTAPQKGPLALAIGATDNQRPLKRQLVTKRPPTEAASRPPS